MMALVVKTHNPWRTRVLLILLVIALSLAGWALFEYGRFSAGFDSIEVNQEHRVLLKHVDELEGQIEDLREEKAVLERAAQIERKAYDELDATLKVLQAEILELKEELAFYRGIVSPRETAQGLHIQRFHIEPNGKPHGYRYQVILTQVLKNDKAARGNLDISIAGLLASEPKVLKINEVSDKTVKSLEYGFKYFQSLEGDITLPGDFKPQRVNIIVTPKSGHSGQQHIEKTFDWPA